MTDRCPSRDPRQPTIQCDLIPGCHGTHESDSDPGGRYWDLEPWEEIAALHAKLDRLTAIHSEYFDMNHPPTDPEVQPEPEDVWRYDRDFRQALANNEENQQ